MNSENLIQHCLFVGSESSVGTEMQSFLALFFACELYGSMAI